MDHEQRRQRQQHSPRGNAPGSGRCGSSSRKHKGRGKKPIKVVYISNPVRVKTSAAGFRALVQELTGRDADPSKYSPEDLAGAAVAAGDPDCGAAQGLSPGDTTAASSDTIVAIPSPAAVDHLHEHDASPAAAPADGGDYYYDEEEDEGGFGSQLLEKYYTVFSPPTLLYDHHPHNKVCDITRSIDPARLFSVMRATLSQSLHDMIIPFTLYCMYYVRAPNLYAGMSELLAPIRGQHMICCIPYAGER
jgi:hypothetical protein